MDPGRSRAGTPRGPCLAGPGTRLQEPKVEVFGLAFRIAGWERFANHNDTWILARLTAIRTPWLTHVARAVKVFGSGWPITVIGLGLVAFLMIFRRWRHLLVFLGITATGAGVLLAIRTGNAAGLGAGARWALCGGPAIFLVAIGIIHLVNTRRLRDARVWTRLGSSAAATGLAVAGSPLSPLTLVGLLLALLVAHAALES